MTRAARLWFVLGANLGLVGALMAVGIAAHSVGVWAEGTDYLADAGAIGVALFALRAEAPTPRRPQGRPKATRYAALVNAGWLSVLAVLVAIGAVDRLASGVPRVQGLPVLVVSGAAALVMTTGALILGGDSDDEGDEGEEGEEGGGGALSVRAALLDTAADAAAAAGVAVAGGVIFATGTFYWLDPAIALVISVVVALQALRLLARVRTALRD